MSAFGIFVLVLTIIYAIYYSVMIARDIIENKKKGIKGSSGEVFDVSSFGGEKAVEVKEVKGGFSVGGLETVTDKKEAVKEEPQIEQQKSNNQLQLKPAVENISQNLAEAEDDINEEISLHDEAFQSMLSRNIYSDLFNKVVAARNPENTLVNVGQ